VRRRIVLVVAFLGPAILLPAATYLLTRTTSTAAPGRVSYGRVQALFATAGCESCHPGVNPSLNLLHGHSYAALVNVAALEDPHYAYVVAGDPARSFLYLKVAGFGKQAQVGGRMPFRKPQLSKADLQLLAGPSQPGGEEHYKVAATDAGGHHVLGGVPSGAFEQKAYAPAHDLHLALRGAAPGSGNDCRLRSRQAGAHHSDRRQAQGTKRAIVRTCCPGRPKLSYLLTTRPTRVAQTF
jgi:hypothetical protein